MTNLVNVAGMMRTVVDGARFVVVPCRGDTAEVTHHGPWTEATGSEGASRFAESMGMGPVVVVRLDGSREFWGVTEERLRMSRVEVREVAPYAYAIGYGRVAR